MKFTRMLSRNLDEGKHVSELIEWKRLDCVVKDIRSGEEIFRQNAVEVPEQWSQNAANILSQKYFRKAGVPLYNLDTQDPTEDSFIPLDKQKSVPVWLRPRKPDPSMPTGCESSARHVFHRLAGAWAYHGWLSGLLDKEEQAQIFYDECFLALAWQYAAPNSPQWFNTGLWWAYGITGDDSGMWVCDDGTPRRIYDTYSRPQPHACFLNGLEDDLVNEGGIFDTLTTEARIFKNGSGSGINVSKLRGPTEKLSAGGTASGAMSFLRVFDSGAGAIKSGGTTRRAAKMVIMDVDHPEIEQFVDWKVKEEAKAAAMNVGSQVLRDAYLGNASYDDPMIDYPKQVIERAQYYAPEVYGIGYEEEANRTIDGQNSNNSVRVTDAFMRAVTIPSDESYWRLKARSDKIRTGERVWTDTVWAPNLWKKISTSAWACADPGLLFHDTINAWHTCPNDGEIRTCNPCFAPGTLIVTDQGAVPIEDLVGKTVRVHDGSRWVEIDNFRETGRNQVVLKIKLHDGSEVRLTPYHRMVLDSGEECRADELRVGMKLMLNDVEYDGLLVENGAYIKGFLLGDGHLGGQGRSRQPGLNLHFPKWMCKDRLYSSVNELEKGVVNTSANSELAFVEPASDRSYLRMVGLAPYKDELNDWCSTYRSRLPDRCFCWDRRSKLEFIAGLFDADGTAMDTANGFAYQLVSIHREMLADVQVLLKSVGVRSHINLSRKAGFNKSLGYDSKDCWCLTISQAGSIVLSKQVLFARLKSFSNKFCKYNVKPRMGRIVAIEEDGIEEIVYCCTVPDTHRVSLSIGIVTGQCAEYHFLDNTACNLASAKLTAFLKSDGSIDVVQYVHVMRLFTVVLDISISMASFPTARFAKGTYDYRTLGLGYADLGGLLMRMGIPYDSDEGRELAGALTSLMTGVAYATSAEMAQEVGPFPMWEDNADSFRSVMKKHRAAIQFNKDDGCSGRVVEEAARYWNRILRMKSFRNAQTTLVAPTGTISFVMDCDTTGMECEFALVKYKHLAGGGTMKMISGAVDKALLRLGYDSEGRDAIRMFVEVNGFVPGDTTQCTYAVNPEHLAVFDCSNPAPGQTRCLSWQAHVKMLASIQPFLSGAASKTINLPNSATVQDVSDAYEMCWRMGVKAVALYRDGCKLSQPLQTAPIEKKEIDIQESLEEALPFLKRFRENSEKPENQEDLKTYYDHLRKMTVLKERGQKEHLPWRRGAGYTQKAKVGGQSLFWRVSEYPDGRPGEIFIVLAGAGSTLRAFAECMAIGISVALQHGTPIHEIAENYLNVKFEPSGFVEGHEHVRFASSIADLIAKDLLITYCNRTDLSVQREVAGEAVETRSGPTEYQKTVAAQDIGRPTGEPCPNCHSETRIVGTCLSCTNCGWDGGCG